MLYAVTPRFAPTSTPQQLDVAAKLLREYPDVYFHTHLSENLEFALIVLGDDRVTQATYVAGTAPHQRENR